MKTVIVNPDTKQPFIVDVPDKQENIAIAINLGKQFRNYENLHGITDYSKILYDEFGKVYSKLSDDERNFVQTSIRIQTKIC